ncbi:MAG: sigma-70 family RNA polymerase sigma factor [Wenzhouxiangellaceae bacterium]
MLLHEPAKPLPHSATAEPTAAPAASAPSTIGFRLVMLRHHRQVFRLAVGLLRDEREAEDACQEAFLRYWQHRQRVEQPRLWLLRVVRNECLSRLRRHSRAVVESGIEVAEPADDRDPSWHQQQGELSQQLQRAIDSLPEPQRSLVLMFDVQGIDGASCARILELSINQVKVYLHRARKRLRTHLEHAL